VEGAAFRRDLGDDASVADVNADPRPVVTHRPVDASQWCDREVRRELHPVAWFGQ
jgi:hypothetical protein